MRLSMFPLPWPLRWLRRKLWCSKGEHRLTLSVDHATLTLLCCRDCEQRFKLTDLSNGGSR